MPFTPRCLNSATRKYIMQVGYVGKAGILNIDRLTQTVKEFPYDKSRVASFIWMFTLS